MSVLLRGLNLYRAVKKFVLPVRDYGLVGWVGSGWNNDVGVAGVTKVPISDSHIGAGCEKEGVRLCYAEVHSIHRVAGNLQVKRVVSMCVCVCVFGVLLCVCV